MGGIFDDRKAMALGDSQDGVHLASDSRVMNGDDDPRAVRDGVFDLGLVDVHGIGSDIDEHELCPCEHEGGSSG